MIDVIKFRIRRSKKETTSSFEILSDYNTRLEKLKYF